RVLSVVMIPPCPCAHPAWLYLLLDLPPNVTLSLPLHDALPISPSPRIGSHVLAAGPPGLPARLTVLRHPAQSAERRPGPARPGRSEEHTSELQSREKLVCRLLLEHKHHTSSFI